MSLLKNQNCQALHRTPCLEHFILSITHQQQSPAQVLSACRKLMEGAAEAGISIRGRLKDMVNVAQLRVILTATGNEPTRYDCSSHLCYHVMGLVHKIWAPVPGGIKDYIATPKSNGYRVGAINL